MPEALRDECVEGHGVGIDARIPKEETCFAIDEPSDEPRGGYSVDARAWARNPNSLSVFGALFVSPALYLRFFRSSEKARDATSCRTAEKVDGNSLFKPAADSVESPLWNV
jgi:hypothetical protein